MTTTKRAHMCICLVQLSYILYFPFYFILNGNHKPSRFKIIFKNRGSYAFSVAPPLALDIDTRAAPTLTITHKKLEQHFICYYTNLTICRYHSELFTSPRGRATRLRTWFLKQSRTDKIPFILFSHIFAQNAISSYDRAPFIAVKLKTNTCPFLKTPVSGLSELH